MVLATVASRAPILFFTAIALSLSACGGGGSSGAAADTLPAQMQRMVDLGEQLFSDKQLSSSKTVSCQSCHDSSINAFTDIRPAHRLSEGVNSKFTNRNAPTLMYAAFVPVLQQVDDDGEPLWIGGLFHDGRADTFIDQAFGPLLSPNEMDNTSSRGILQALIDSTTQYTIDDTAIPPDNNGTSAANAFRLVFGDARLPSNLNTLSDTEVTRSVRQLASALAAFQSTPAFAPFSSKYDYFLKGQAALTPAEIRGLAAFVRADKGNCAACHAMDRNTPNRLPLFTDFSYDNLGLPTVAGDSVDNGLADTVKVAGDKTLLGKFRVPTLRNVALTAPYMHNGVFNELKEVVEFYNDRDKNPPATEFPATTNHSELGNLGLSSQEVDDIVAFMNTLTDGYTP